MNARAHQRGPKTRVQLAVTGIGGPWRPKALPCRDRLALREITLAVRALWITGLGRAAAFQLSGRPPEIDADTATRSTHATTTIVGAAAVPHGTVVAEVHGVGRCRHREKMVEIPIDEVIDAAESTVT